MSTFNNTVDLGDDLDGVQKINVNVTINPVSTDGTPGGITFPSGQYQDTLITATPNTISSIPEGSVKYAFYNLGPTPGNPIDPSTLQAFTVNGVSIPPYLPEYKSNDIGGYGTYGEITYDSGVNNLIIIYTMKIV